MKEEKDGSALTGKSSKQKLFSIDEIVIDKTDNGRNDKKISSSEAKGHVNTSEEVVKEMFEKNNLTEPEASHEGTTEKHTVEPRTQSEELEIDENEGRSAKKVERRQKSANSVGPSALLLINKINTCDIPGKVLGILSTSLDKSFGLKEKNAIIICALKRLDKLNVLDLGEDIETNLQDHLDHRSNVSRMQVTDLINILEYFIKVSTLLKIQSVYNLEFCS